MIKLINKYKCFPIQVKASLWFCVCAFLQKGISFITTPIFTRLLDTAEYGQFNVFNSWLSILTVFVSLNLFYGVYVRGLVEFDNDRNVFTSSLQGLTLILIFLWTLIYLFSKEFWNSIFGLTSSQMIFLIMLIWTTAVFNFWATEQRVDYKYKKLVLITFLMSLLKPIIGIVFVVISIDKVTARIFGLVLVEFIICIGLFISQMIKGKKIICIKYWKHALAFNIPLIPHYLSSSILNSADRIMIERIVDESAAGIYSLAFSVSMLITMFSTALMQTIEPWMYKKIKDKNIYIIRKVAYPAFVIVAILNLLVIIFAPEMVRIFAPSEYYDAIYIIPPIAMSVFFIFSYTFFAVFEFYYKKTNMIAFATSIGAVLKIILNILFIPRFGYYAAGYTTLVCYVIYALLHCVFMLIICKRKLNGELPFNIVNYSIISLIFLIIGFSFSLTYDYIIIRYVLVIIVLVLIILNYKKIDRVIRNLISIRNS